MDFPIPQNSFWCVLQKMGSRVCRRAISRHGPRGECGMPAVPRRGPGTSRYTNPAVYPYCCFQAPVAALPAPFSYTHRPGRSGRHGPAGWGVDFPIPENSFGCVLQKMGSRARRRATSRHGPRGECGMPAGQARAVYPGPPTQDRPPSRLPCTDLRPKHPNPSTLYRPPRNRLPCTAHPETVYPGPPTQSRPPEPSTLYRPPWTAHPGPPTKPSTLYRPPRNRLPYTAYPFCSLNMYFTRSLSTLSISL